jgi:hypothetical protein
MLVGSSHGGCVSHGFTRSHSARVIGFMSAKGNCHIGGPSPAAAVPGYLFIGEEDPVSPGARVAITQLFNDNRPNGALWAMALEIDSGHEFPRDNDATFAWMDAILARRLPATAGEPLRTITEASGWLGNSSSRMVGAYSCYSDDRVLASWLPDQASAAGWQTIVGGTGILACN